MKKKRIKYANLSLRVSGYCILFILVFFMNGYSQDIHRAVSEGDLEKPGDTFLYSQSDISRKIQVNEDLTVEEIEENVIVATHRFPWAGNCLAVRVSPSELVLVDTPWELTGTDALLTFLRERFGRVHITAVNTHFHQDNLGGNEILLSRRIPVYGSDLTVRLLEEKGAAVIRRTLKSLSDPKHKRYFDAYKNLNLKPPDHVFELKKGLTLHIGEEDIEIFYPGPAHTLDNIVVYFPMRKILFGGCMIRSLESTGIFPPSDGDLDSWPRSAKNVLERFPEARIVIPGHGTWGDIRLIQHTFDIANQSLRQSELQKRGSLK